MWANRGHVTDTQAKTERGGRTRNLKITGQELAIAQLVDSPIQNGREGQEGVPTSLARYHCASPAGLGCSSNVEHNMMRNNHSTRLLSHSPRNLRCKQNLHLPHSEL